MNAMGMGETSKQTTGCHTLIMWESNSHYEKNVKNNILRSPSGYTFDDSHCTGTTEIVQPIKSVKDNIDDNKEIKI